MSPRHVRNFWIETNVEGETKAATGPRTMTGEAEIVIKYRNNGVIATPPVRVFCDCGTDGSLRIHTTDENGRPVTLARGER